MNADRRRVTALRLAAQGVAGATAPDPVDVVRGMLAMQGQDYLGVLWSVALRTPDASEADVERAHTSGALVRSWPFRGTLHLVAAEDLGWMLSLSGERTMRRAAGRHRQLGLDDADFARAASIAHERLSGSAASRESLLAAFADGGVELGGQRGAHLLTALALRGVIVLVSRGEYALLEQHVASPRHLEPDAAADELALRYFTGHGPATVDDLAWWSGLPLGTVRPATSRVRERLDGIRVGGVEYLHRPGLESEGEGTHALPGFDEYLLGYRDRGAALDPSHAAVIVPGGNGMFLSTIVDRGRVIGTWRRTRRAASVRIEVVPFAPLPRRTSTPLRAAFARYGRFIGMPVEITGLP